MSNCRRVLAAAVLFLVSACRSRENSGEASQEFRATADSSASTAAHADQKAEEDAIRALRHRQDQAMVAKDTGGVVSIYADDVVYVPDGIPPEEGRAAVRTAWGNGLRAPGLTIQYTPTAIEVAEAGDMAYERGRVQATVRGRPAESGNYLYIWKKLRGQWKVALWIWSTRAEGSKQGDGSS